MVSITVISRSGVQQRVEADEGATLMQTIRAIGDEIEALCGGCCSCATCHVYVDPAFADRLPKVTASEDELLDSSDHRKPHSRLSCQIVITASLAGLTTTVAPAD